MEQQLKPKSLFEGVTPYHLLVLVIASCGWLFDCMDQRIFVMARQASMTDLLGPEQAAKWASIWGGAATACLMVGWGTGGILFGVFSDRFGRVKCMIVTLFVYSGFTGLSSLSVTPWDFCFYRILVGLGVGGMFGAATTLIAETVPSHFRSLALGALQALSATGNILGAYIARQLTPELTINFMGMEMPGWRAVFLVGILPSLLVIPIMSVLREPEAWRKAKEEADSGEKNKEMGSIHDLFKQNPWRRHAIVGICLGLSGMVGLWGIGFFSPELITYALSDKPMSSDDLEDSAAIVMELKSADTPFSQYFLSECTEDTKTAINQFDGSSEPSEALNEKLLKEFNELLMGENLYAPERFANIELSDNTNDRIALNPTGSNLIRLNRELLENAYPTQIRKIKAYVGNVRGNALMLQDVGAFLGMFAFTMVATFLSRRLAFLGSFIICMLVTMFVFNTLNSETHAYWMLPLLGFAQLSVFGGYSIYFPELFPTRLRGTGVGFCYNTVRYLTASFPFLFGYLVTVLPFRLTAILMSFIYVVGMVALIWAPETKGKDLPTEA